MSTWGRSEHTVTTIRYTVPAPHPLGAAWAEVANALDAAKSECRRQNGGDPLSDDAIRVTAEDDQIVISFEKKNTAARPEPWGAGDHR